MKFDIIGEIVYKDGTIDQILEEIEEIEELKGEINDIHDISLYHIDNPEDI